MALLPEEILSKKLTQNPPIFLAAFTGVLVESRPDAVPRNRTYDRFSEILLFCLFSSAYQNVIASGLELMLLSTKKVTVWSHVVIAKG